MRLRFCPVVGLGPGDDLVPRQVTRQQITNSAGRHRMQGAGQRDFARPRAGVTDSELRHGCIGLECRVQVTPRGQELTS